MDWLDDISENNQRVYHRRNPKTPLSHPSPADRVFRWVDRSLCFRGRKSVSEVPTILQKANQVGRQNKNGRKKNHGPKYSNKMSKVLPTDFVKEQVNYFQEVDSFELDEEDISFQQPERDLNGRWQSQGITSDIFAMRKMRLSGTINETINQTPKDGMGSGGKDVLSLILQSPQSETSSASSDLLVSSDGVSFHKVRYSRLKTQDKGKDGTNCPLQHDDILQRDAKHSLAGKNASADTPVSLLKAFENVEIEDSDQFGPFDNLQKKRTESDQNIRTSVISENVSGSFLGDFETDIIPGYNTLLAVCGQAKPFGLLEAFTEFCDASHIVKIGEGTYGEAFKGDCCVFKVVPVDGDFLVNGEVQKTSADLLVEVLLSMTLNMLRSNSQQCIPENKCMNFIQTKAIRVCQGKYHEYLLKAWEDWDEKHSSENEHPMIFPDKQLYVAFVLEDGGTDLEHFVLSSFDEVHSILIQVTTSLAVAEVACEFEHRDLHWGNILISRTEGKQVQFLLRGKLLEAQNIGLSVAIIDFTLSRINTGNKILFSDLSSDPALFEGPKRDTQAETYRRMLNVTNGDWEGRYPKTNVLWLHYLADILLYKKAFRASTNERRELSAFRRRLLSYDSAEAVLSDNFFNGVLVQSCLNH